MRCPFPGVGSNPRNGYICFNCNNLFLLFLSFLLSADVLFQVLHVHFYLFSNQSVNDTPFWYHSFKKTKTLSFLRRLSVFYIYMYVYMYVRIVTGDTSNVLFLLKTCNVQCFTFSYDDLDLC